MSLGGLIYLAFHLLQGKIRLLFSPYYLHCPWMKDVHNVEEFEVFLTVGLTLLLGECHKLRLHLKLMPMGFCM